MWTAWGLKWLGSLVSVTETLKGVSAATGEVPTTPAPTGSPQKRPAKREYRPIPCP